MGSQFLRIHFRQNAEMKAMKKNLQTMTIGKPHGLQSSITIQSRYGYFCALVRVKVKANTRIKERKESR